LTKSTIASDDAAAIATASTVGQTGHGLRDYALLLALACCWSSTYPLTKIGLGSIPPVTFISARSLIAAFFLLAVLRVRKIPMPTDARAWKLFAFQQTINSTFPFLIITWAQQYVPAASTVVLASTTPIFAFVITWAFTRHEPATLLKLAGAVLGLAGTAVIIGLDALGGLGREIYAEIAILLATVSFACATIFGLRLSGYDPTVIAAGSLLFGGLVLLPPRNPPRTPLDIAPDGGSARGHCRHGHLLERARADAVLYVSHPARHPDHQRARLSAHSHRRCAFGDPARRTGSVQSRAWAGSGHGRRCRYDYSGRTVSTVDETPRAITYDGFKSDQPRHCEEAQPTKQSSLFLRLLDCFASLAMTTFPIPPNPITLTLVPIGGGIRVTPPSAGARQGPQTGRARRCGP
jgi:drug/metabolite transporter (DMT)-like permease